MPVRRLTTPDVAEFVGELLSPTRTRPIVAVTSNPHAPAAAVDADRLAIDLGDVVDLVAFETGETTWALTAALPSRLDVYGGAVRIWWPGLTASSSPQDHPLMFCFSAAEAERTARRTILAIRARGRPTTPASPRPPSVPARPRLGRVVRANVASVGDGRVEVATDEATGRLAEADAPLERVALDLEVGEPLFVRPVLSTNGEPPTFSVRGVLQEPWPRIARRYGMGEVVRGRVCRVEQNYVLVEILPGAALLVPRSEVDWSRFRHPSELVRVGQSTKVKVLAIDEAARTGTGSIKQAYGAEPRPAISAGLGQAPFLEDDLPPSATAPHEPEEDREALAEEVRSLVADREDLVRRLREKNDEVASLRKELRSAQDRARAREADALDPTSSENAFLAAVRIEYARAFDEGSRASHPLQRMRVGREFLHRLRALEGFDVGKVVEVCAQVACGRAHEIPGRSVHELHAAERGAPGRTRASDGAKAWRGSLQDGAPGARRLHWWEIPGRDGRTIEFASVAHHDDVSIPS